MGESSERDPHPGHRPVFQLVRIGWEQECAVCGDTFRSKKQAAVCGNACKQRRKRARRRAQPGGSSVR